MKLQNKKTGEIGYLYANKNENYNVLDADDKVLAVYPSLAALNEEWEDYEEPKKYWFISRFGYVVEDIDENFDADKKRKEIGNYFETKEEAEKAVEKLKAWKRLKDAGFKFRDWEDDSEEEQNYAIVHCFMPSLTRKRGIWEPMSFEDIQDDLNLLFGGEEWM